LARGCGGTVPDRLRCTGDADGKDAIAGRCQLNWRDLLERHGRTYSEDLGIRLEANTPSALFCWLCAALLFSARINKPSTAVHLLFIATRL
jgi:hypothetical protein